MISEVQHLAVALLTMGIYSIAVLLFLAVAQTCVDEHLPATTTGTPNNITSIHSSPYPAALLMDSKGFYWEKKVMGGRPLLLHDTTSNIVSRQSRSDLQAATTTSKRTNVM